MEEENHALQKAHESLGACVHHAGGLEHWKELRGPRQRVLGLFQHVLHQWSDIGHVSPGDGFGRLAHDGEYGSLHRLFDGRIQILHPGRERDTELPRVDALAMLQSTGETEKEVGQHHTAVAASTQNRSVCRLLSYDAYGTVRAALQIVHDGLNRESEVGSRISIRNRKDVDSVELTALLLCPLARRHERPSQAWTINVADLHRAKIESALDPRNAASPGSDACAVRSRHIASVPRHFGNGTLDLQAAFHDAMEERWRIP